MVLLKHMKEILQKQFQQQGIASILYMTSSILYMTTVYDSILYILLHLMEHSMQSSNILSKLNVTFLGRVLWSKLKVSSVLVKCSTTKKPLSLKYHRGQKSLSSSDKCHQKFYYSYIKVCHYIKKKKNLRVLWVISISVHLSKYIKL
jgi:hypothetical protein